MGGKKRGTPFKALCSNIFMKSYKEYRAENVLTCVCLVMCCFMMHAFGIVIDDDVCCEKEVQRTNSTNLNFPFPYFN
jgi:hypothetical protein